MTPKMIPPFLLFFFTNCNVFISFQFTDNFVWPQAEKLPADIHKICRYNGINWIHDYQDACIAKIVRFIKGEAGEPNYTQTSL